MYPGYLIEICCKLAGLVCRHSEVAIGVISSLLPIAAVSAGFWSDKLVIVYDILDCLWSYMCIYFQGYS